MFGFLRGLFWGFLLIATGWLVGSLYPAPAAVVAPLKQRSDAALARLDLSPARIAELRAALSPEEFRKLGGDAAQLAAASGQAVVIERDELSNRRTDSLEPEPISAVIAPPATPSAPATSASGFEDLLALCPRMTISNAPPADATGNVRDYAKIVSVQGVQVAINPTRGACLSSSFGARGGRMHEGTDYYSADGGPILAAADGVVIEKKYRDDYGNMLLIDHGRGVYTRYAHLSSFASGVDVGAQVRAGQQIGLMGNTAAYRIPVHLHYEVLLGDYNNPKASFGLTPHSPFEYRRG